MLGDTETVWVEMHEREIHNSTALFTQTITDAIKDILRAISENVFANVGFMDVSDCTVLLYDRDAQTMNGSF